MSTNITTEAREEVWASYSSMSAYRGCPQAWTYRYLRHLDRGEGDYPIERDFGSWWGALRAAEAITRGTRAGTILHFPETLRVLDGVSISTTSEEGGVLHPLAVLETAHQWWSKQPEEYHVAFDDRIGGTLVERLRVLNARWTETWAKDREHEEVLAVEVKFRRVIPATEETPDVVITGYLDEVYRDTRRGLIVVRDHKAYKSVESQSALTDLMDSQLHLYAWGIAPWLKEHGLKIDAVAYDQVRSIAPSLPAITTTGALSRSVTDYDLATYLAWAAGPDGDGVPWGEEGAYYVSGAKKGQPKFGKYTAEESVIERLSDPLLLSKWFRRTLVPINTNVIRAHLLAARDTAEGMQRTRLRFESTGQAVRNLGKPCTWCPFAGLCRAEMIGGAGVDVDLEALGLVRKDPRRRG